MPRYGAWAQKQACSETGDETLDRSVVELDGVSRSTTTAQIHITDTRKFNLSAPCFLYGIQAFSGVLPGVTLK